MSDTPQGGDVMFSAHTPMMLAALDGFVGMWDLAISGLRCGYNRRVPRRLTRHGNRRLKAQARALLAEYDRTDPDLAKRLRAAYGGVVP